MAESKPPKLTIGEDKPSSIRIWRRKFNAWCILQKEWRDVSKDPSTADHWLEANRPKEIAAFQLALPDDVLSQFDISLIPANRVQLGEK